MNTLAPEVSGTERVIFGVTVDYRTVRHDHAGNASEVLASARRGDRVVLDPIEEARLDALAMLVPAGEGEAWIDDELARRKAEFAAHNAMAAQSRSLG